MEQRLAIYLHNEQQLVFISMLNNDKNVEYSASVERQYQHARSLHKRLLTQDDVPGLRSGWMFSLINTDFSGWTVELLPEVFTDIHAATVRKDEMIANLDQFHEDLTYVGARNTVKGVYGSGLHTPKNWATRFKPENMTKAKVLEKIRIVAAGLLEPLTPAVINDCYMAIMCPDTNGPRNKNFGSYEVNSLSTLFRFIRQSLGKDMTNA